MAAIVLLCVQTGMSYLHHTHLFQDAIVGSSVCECLDLLDYGCMVDGLAPPPRGRVRAMVVPISVVSGVGTPGDPIDLTGDDNIPTAQIVPTRLDFTIVVDELDNGGLFGTRQEGEDCHIPQEGPGDASPSQWPQVQ